MYCKNCGQQIQPGSSVCLTCGVPAGQGKRYCTNCGNEVSEFAVVCVKCGCGTNPAPTLDFRKSRVIAGILGILLGGLGIHNFYLGFTTKGVIQILLSTVGALITCGTSAIAACIWGLIEGIMILTGSINTDATGNSLKD